MRAVREKENNIQEISVLALVRVSDPLKNIFSQLEKSGVKVTATSDIVAALKTVAENPPQIVLVSWGLKCFDPKQVYDLITGKYNIPCIGFCETESPQANQLAKTPISNVLLPPLGAPGLLSKVKAVFKKAQAAPVAPAVTQEQRKQWDETENSIVLIHSNQEKKPSEVSASNYDEKERGAEIISGSGVSKSSKNPNNHQSHLVKKAAQEALATIGQQIDNKAKAVGKISKVSAFVIDTQGTRGYLVGGCTGDALPSEFLKLLYEKFQGNMGKLGDPLKDPCSVLELNLESFPFFDWAEQNADFVVVSNYEEREVVFAYLPIDNFPDLIEGHEKDMIVLSLRDHLIEETTVPFELFVHLPLNKKFLMYYKKGATIARGWIEKLVKFKVEKAYIKRSAREEFLTYCLKNEITKPLEENQEPLAVSNAA